MADYSFNLALCTENKCVPTIYHLLGGYENLGIPLSVNLWLKGNPKCVHWLLS